MGGSSNKPRIKLKIRELDFGRFSQVVFERNGAISRPFPMEYKHSKELAERLDEAHQIVSALENLYDDV